MKRVPGDNLPYSAGVRASTLGLGSAAVWQPLEVTPCSLGPERRVLRLERRILGLQRRNARLGARRRRHALGLFALFALQGEEVAFDAHLHDDGNCQDAQGRNKLVALVYNRIVEPGCSDEEQSQVGEKLDERPSYGAAGAATLAPADR